MSETDNSVKKKPTANRAELMSILMSEGVSFEQTEMILRPMVGRPWQEKEKIAAELVRLYKAHCLDLHPKN